MEKVHLTGKEKSELWGEGLITVILLLMLNLAVVVLGKQMIASDPHPVSRLARPGPCLVAE